MILPELEGDMHWNRLTEDARPRAKLTALGDQLEEELKANPERYPEIGKKDFDERS